MSSQLAIHVGACKACSRSPTQNKYSMDVEPVSTFIGSFYLTLLSSVDSPIASDNELPRPTRRESMYPSRTLANESLANLEAALKEARKVFIARRDNGMTAHSYGPNGEDNLAEPFDEIEGWILSLREWWL